MKIVEFKGGLGNQMFQYAFYRALLHRGFQVKADIRSYDRYQQHNGFELERIFGIQLDLANEKECIHSGFPRSYFIHRVLKRMGLPVAKRYIDVEGGEALRYSSELLSNLPEHCYLTGYWQCEKWFSEVHEEVRSHFTFSETDLDDGNRALLEEIRGTRSVSLHVRRGDYNNIPMMQNICMLEGYYRPAIDFLQKRKSDLRFFVFSDDIPWCKENLKLEHCCYVDCNRGSWSYRDMQLMSSCKHNIIANSTFSWWGAWLNRNPEKLVIAPPRFLNTGEREDIIPGGWIKISQQAGGALNDAR